MASSGMNCEGMCFRSVRAAVAWRRSVDLVGLPVAVPAAHTVWVWCGFPSGSFTVAPQLGEDVPPMTSPTSAARLRAALRSRSSTRGHSSQRNVRSDRRSLVFTTARTGFGTRIPPVRDVQPHTPPAGFVLHLTPQLSLSEPSVITVGVDTWHKVQRAWQGVQ
jgi:hypothetical protein